MSGLSLFGFPQNPMPRERLGLGASFFDSLERNIRSLRPEFDFSPMVELRREGDDLSIAVELPGLDPDRDVKLELRDNRLVIRGERQQKKSEKGYTEFSYGSFSRTVALHPGVTEDQISASYESGVLHVRVAGAYQDRVTALSIPISIE